MGYTAKVYLPKCGPSVDAGYNSLMKDAERSSFAHLHVHSHFSLLEGTAPVTQLVKRAVQDGLPALALTDTHALYGAVLFHEKCVEYDVKPIIGMTVWVKTPLQDALPIHSFGQLVLLAKNPEGYRSLCGLASFLQTAVRQKAISWAQLKPYRLGVIGIDAGHAGWCARYIAANQPQNAARYVSQLGGLFEEDGYLGLAINQPEDEALTAKMIELGSRFGVHQVALQPIYCLEPEESKRLKLLAAIDENCPLDEVPKDRIPMSHHPQLHWISPQDVASRFVHFSEAVQAVGHIVDQCEPSLPDGRPIWPKLPLPDDQTAEQALSLQAKAGLAQIFGPSPKQAIEVRLEKELDSINQTGFAPLFLLVAQITRFARETAVPFNTRGSVANSLVAYCIGITNVDPVEHNLLFERFLNPERANMPDIDLDFCSRRRDEVLHFVRRSFGEDKVALVATISTMQPKSAVRETAKAYGLPEATIKKLTALLPRGWHPDPRRRSQKTFQEIADEIEDPEQRLVMQTAVSLVGQPHHLSVHPGGVVISPGPLTDVVPVQMAPKGFLITQFDFRDIEKIGLPKIDLLGIRALTVLADTAELIDQKPPFDLTQIPMNDEKTAHNLQNGLSIGVFQCESTGAQRTMRQLKAKNLADLAIANAFFKPGPATGGMAASFIRRYRGQEEVSFLHDALAPILSSTKGVLLFQEQVLRIATEVAGLSWAEADHLRRGMSKFDAKAMRLMKVRFCTGCQEQAAFTSEQAETLWEQVIAFAGYGFNQGHATAYADISYRSAYLKTHYPAEFLTARLADHGGFHHPAIYMAEAQRLGFRVMPPHVNFSERKFTLTRGLTEHRRKLEGENSQLLIANDQLPTLWMGLGQVRDLRRSTIDQVIEKRPFMSLADLLQKVKMQEKEARHLIQSGGLDGLGANRAAMLNELKTILRAGGAGQMTFAFAQESAAPPESLAEQLEWETRLLGLPMSANPILVYREKTGDDVPLALLPRLLNMKTTIAGTRLPGWTGGKGFYFGDGRSFIITQLEKNAQPKKKLPAWEPFRLTGRWRVDEWGGGWFEAVSVVGV